MAVMVVGWEWNISEELREMSLMSTGKKGRWNVLIATLSKSFMAMAKLTQLVLRGE
jgi:hypothetical protein